MTKKNKNPIWIADEAATLDVEMNHALLAMLWAKPKKDKRKKAKRIYKELLAQQAAEAETVRPAPNTEVYATKNYFDVREVGRMGEILAEFEVMHDGGFHVAVSNDSWGGHFADINMTAEQFAAFKQWVMEN